MTLTVETFENRSTVVTETVLDVIRLDKNLSVFRQITTETVDTNEGSMKAPTDPKIAETTGLIDDKNLSFLKKGREFKTITKLVTMTPALRAVFASMPYSDAWDHELFKTDAKRGVELFSHFQNGGTADDLVIMDTSSHMLFDRHGDVLPVGIMFEYISHGMVTNASYDLTKAAELLLARDDVDVWAHQGSWKNDRIAYTNGHSRKEGVKLAETVEEAIFAIPSYNADRARNRCLYFIWKPTREQYSQVWEAAKAATRKGGYPSTAMHQMIFELDMLGLRAGGAAKYDTYWKSDDAPAFDDED